MVNVVLSTNVIHSARRFWVQQRRATHVLQLERERIGMLGGAEQLAERPRSAQRRLDATTESLVGL